MKRLVGALVFLSVFVAMGIAMHAALYQKPGIFIWSVQPEKGTDRTVLGRTTLELDPVAFEIAAEIEQGGVAAEVAASEEEAEATSPPAGSADLSEVVEAAPEAESTPTVLSLFNGKDLGDWEITEFGGEGDVFINEEGNLEFGFGAIMTGVTWGAEVPATSNYEITLEAMKLDGFDFFLALTFPVKESHASLIVGGWGGGVVGISCVDDLNASENETMNIEGFARNEWHAIRLRVTDKKLQAWIDEEQKVDLRLEGRKISLLPGDIVLSEPLGIASFQTRAQYRNIQWRDVTGEEEDEF